MPAETSPFQVLLVDDDTISREFLSAALRACGASVAAFAEPDAALEFAQTHACNLLILDQNLGGSTGADLLARLDHVARATGAPRAPALAITAAAEANAPELVAAGFAEVLPKPITGAALQAALQRHGCAPPAGLDDDAALAACGSADVGRRLRRLFLDLELPAIVDELDRCGEDFASLRPTLHRLRAACGFCGATGLAEAAAALHRTIGAGEPAAHAAAGFRAQLAQTIVALRARLDAE